MIRWFPLLQDGEEYLGSPQLDAVYGKGSVMHLLPLSQAQFLLKKELDDRAYNLISPLAPSSNPRWCGSNAARMLTFSNTSFSKVSIHHRALDLTQAFSLGRTPPSEKGTPYSWHLH